MKLTRHEIALLVALGAALTAGLFVKHFRSAHPPLSPPAKAASKK
jgi:hypothetical protein